VRNTPANLIDVFSSAQDIGDLINQIFFNLKKKQPNPRCSLLASLQAFEELMG
jgi:hypothetical protein